MHLGMNMSISFCSCCSADDLDLDLILMLNGSCRVRHTPYICVPLPPVITK